ncbi:MAG: hypothetical protein A3E83_02880 [Gammaproteobacteria bacterium RIFCSPHIGHO2_12_FULL_41_20]|nr:MAG: hypothetical protein A3E83_02880 [Gammaproteobacteria bacterium RIFCSPHIGHO2_12_FULL_41_20]
MAYARFFPNIPLPNGEVGSGLEYRRLVQLAIHQLEKRVQAEKEKKAAHLHVSQSASKTPYPPGAEIEMQLMGRYKR